MVDCNQSPRLRQRNQTVPPMPDRKAGHHNAGKRRLANGDYSNRRSELVSKCRHENKLYLSNCTRDIISITFVKLLQSANALYDMSIFPITSALMFFLTHRVPQFVSPKDTGEGLRLWAKQTVVNHHGVILQVFRAYNVRKEECNPQYEWMGEWIKWYLLYMTIGHDCSYFKIKELLIWPHESIVINDTLYINMTDPNVCSILD